jgi:hypothetical protein
MHYIPFSNEKIDNRYNDINCYCCPLVTIKYIDNIPRSVTCPYNSNYGYEPVEVTNLDKPVQVTDLDNFNITLRPAIMSNCPVQYRDPVERVHYLQVYCNINNKFVDKYKEIMNDNSLSSEDKNDKLQELLSKINQCQDLLKELFPKHHELYEKVMVKGYHLDENLNPVK